MPLFDSDDGVAVPEAPSTEEQVSRAPPRPVADLEHPWLGLESFRDETRAYFFGRDAEIAEIHLRIRSQQLLLLYGRSGLGKTSILSAGLMPRLRVEGHRPVIERLDYKVEEHGPLDQFFFALFDSDGGDPATRFLKRKAQITSWENDINVVLAPRIPRDPARLLPQAFPMPQDARSRLWLRLHWRKRPPNISHLILDQLEEVFTLGVHWPEAEHEVRDALSILLQGAVPEPISRLIAEHDTFLEHFDPDSTPVRVILALRDDYVYALNRWKRHLPMLGQNNFELRSLRGLAAFDAVFKPGELRCRYVGEVMQERKADAGLPAIVSEETARRIVHFVAGEEEAIPLEEIEAVPPILSLLCRELNERRFTDPAGSPEKPAAQITFHVGETDIATIIATFYERCLGGRPEAVRIFIEEELVSPYSGARLQQDERSVLKVFTDGCDIAGATDGRHAAGYGDQNAARACLEGLVNERLLTAVGGRENPSYELIHDLVAAVSGKSRAAREERFAKEQADHRAEQEKRAKEEAQARAWILALVALAAVAAAIFGFWQKGQAEKNESKLAASKAGQSELLYIIERDVADEARRLGQSTLIFDINKKVREYFKAHPPDDGDESELRIQALALEQYGDVQLAQGQFSDAYDSFQESLSIRNRVLNLTSRLQDPVWRRDRQQDRAISIDRIGNALIALGRIPEALKKYQEALNIRKDLVTSNSAVSDPASVQLQVDLSYSFENLGDAFVRDGQHTEAQNNFRESMAIRSNLADRKLGTPQQQQSIKLALCSTFDKLGNVLAAEAKYSDALELYQRSNSIRYNLVSGDSENLELQEQLAYSYQHIGEIAELQQKFSEALKNFDQYVRILKLLADRDPGDAQRQLNLALGLEKYGSMHGQLEQYNDALNSFSKSLQILQSLAPKNPKDLRFQQTLSRLLENRGDTFKDLYKLEEAETSYRDSFNLRDQLTKLQPDNPGWQGELSSSFDRLGDIFQIQKNFNEALSNYYEALKIRQRFADRYPDDAGWQGYLAFSFEHIGDVANRKGAILEALGEYRKAFAIRRRFADSRPEEPGRQGDLAGVCWKLAQVLDRRQDAEKEEADRLIQQGLDLLDGISRNGELSPPQKQVRAGLHQLAIELQKPTS
jgi:tetratricopeptide (TPR) repeat protein